MLLSEVKAQAGAIKFLRNSLEEGRLPNALIIEGAEGVGKRFAAMRFAASVLCHSPKNNQDACGSCKSCRVFNAEIHPDLNIISTEDTARTIKIEELNALSDAMSIRAQLEGYKVAIIPKAERISEQLQNTILKTLEEPTGKAIYILTTTELPRLLATVRSRSTVLHFTRLPDETIAEFLRMEDLATPADAMDVARISRGSFKLAKENALLTQGEENALIDKHILPRLGKGGSGGAKMSYEMGVWLKNRKADKKSGGLEGPRLIALKLLEVLLSRLQKRVRTILEEQGNPAIYASAMESVLASNAAIVQNISVEMTLSNLAIELAKELDSND